LPTVYLRDFPEGLHHRSKVRAAIDRTTLKDLVVNALERYLTDEKPESPNDRITIQEETVQKSRPVVSDAWGIAGNVINELEQIDPEDPKREEALFRVKAWIENELNWKSTKR
jgi:hypothetical protein